MQPATPQTILHQQQQQHQQYNQQHQQQQQQQQHIRPRARPCAVIGPQRDQPHTSVSTNATLTPGRIPGSISGSGTHLPPNFTMQPVLYPPDPRHCGQSLSLPLTSTVPPPSNSGSVHVPVPVPVAAQSAPYPRRYDPYRLDYTAAIPTQAPVPVPSPQYLHYQYPHQYQPQPQSHLQHQYSHPHPHPHSPYPHQPHLYKRARHALQPHQHQHPHQLQTHQSLQPHQPLQSHQSLQPTQPEPAYYPVAYAQYGGLEYHTPRALPSRPRDGAPYGLVEKPNCAADPYRARPGPYDSVAQMMPPSPGPVHVPDVAKYKLDYYNRYRNAAYQEVQYVAEHPYSNCAAGVSVSNYDYAAKPPNVYYSGNNIYHHQKPPDCKPYERAYDWDLTNAHHQRYYGGSKQSSYNPLAGIPTEFSPNVISPTESGGSYDSVAGGSFVQEDAGYASQCSTVSRQSAEYRINCAKDYRCDAGYAHRYDRPVEVDPMTKAVESGVRPEKPESNLRKFYEMWKEDQEEAANGETIVPPAEPYALAERPCGAPPVERPPRLSDCVRDPAVVNRQYSKIITKNELNGYITERPKVNASNVPRVDFFSNEIIDVEAKISQSVIHKEVGCNFEIKPCSPLDQLHLKAGQAQNRSPFAVRQSNLVPQHNKFYARQESGEIRDAVDLKNVKPSVANPNVYNPSLPLIGIAETSVICKNAKMAVYTDSEYERKINKESRICGSVFNNNYESACSYRADKQLYGNDLIHSQSIIKNVAEDRPNIANKNLHVKRKKEICTEYIAQEKRLRTEVQDVSNFPELLPNFNQDQTPLSLPDVSENVDKKELYADFVNVLDVQTGIEQIDKSPSIEKSTVIINANLNSIDINKDVSGLGTDNTSVGTVTHPDVAVELNKEDPLADASELIRDNEEDNRSLEMSNSVIIITEEKDLGFVTVTDQEIPVLSKPAFEDGGEHVDDEKMKLLDNFEANQISEIDQVGLNEIEKLDLHLQGEGDSDEVMLMEDADDKNENSKDVMEQILSNDSGLEIKLNADYLINDDTNIVIFEEYSENCLVVEGDMEDKSSLEIINEDIEEDSMSSSYVNKSVIMSTCDTTKDIEDCMLNRHEEGGQTVSGSPVMDDEPPSANINLNYAEKLFEIDYPLDEDAELNGDNDIFTTDLETPVNREILPHVEEKKDELEDQMRLINEDSNSNSGDDCKSSSSQSSTTSSSFEENSLSPKGSSNADINGLEIGGCWIDDIACVETVISEMNNPEESDDYVDSPHVWEASATQDEYEDSSDDDDNDDDDEIMKDSNGNVIMYGKHSNHTDVNAEKNFKYFDEINSYNPIHSDKGDHSESTEIIYQKSCAELKKQIELSKKDDAVEDLKSDSDTNTNRNCDNFENSSVNLSMGKIKTKGAQKYIPPLDNQRLKCHLPLPKNKLLLQKLSVNIEQKKEENSDSQSDSLSANRMRLLKVKPKPKPLFEDVLRNIEETNMSYIKKKLKRNKIKKFVPKVIIKKGDHGSHYTSISKHDESTATTPTKWQPSVCLQRSACIEDMIKIKK